MSWKRLDSSNFPSQETDNSTQGKLDSWSIDFQRLTSLFSSTRKIRRKTANSTQGKEGKRNFPASKPWPLKYVLPKIFLYHWIRLGLTENVHSILYLKSASGKNNLTSIREVIMPTSDFWGSQWILVKSPNRPPNRGHKRISPGDTWCTTGFVMVSCKMYMPYNISEVDSVYNVHFVHNTTFSIILINKYN